MRKLTWMAGGLLALLLAGLLLFRPWGGEQAGPTPEVAEGRRTSVETPILHGRRVGEEPPAVPGAAGPPPADPAIPGGVYRLVGLVLLDDARPFSGVAVRALSLAWGMRPGPEPPVAGRTDETGRFELDVSSLVSTEQKVRTLQVEVDHPDHVLAKQRVDLSPGPGEYEITFHLVRAAAVTGRIVDDGGEPLAGARVALYRMGKSDPVRTPGMAMFDPLDVVGTGIDGRFRLRVGGSGRYLVTAAQKGRVPDAVVLDLEVGRTRETRDLTLLQGEILEGEVRYRGEPVAGSRVLASVPGEGLRLDVNFVCVHWRSGRVQPDGARGVTDAEGRFRLEGLGRGPYLLDADGGPTLPLHPTRRSVEPLEVEAPRSDVVLDVRGRVIEVIVTHEDDPLEAADVDVRVENATVHLNTDADGRTRVLVDPEATVTLLVRHAGFEPTEIQVAPGPSDRPHRERVALARTAPRSRLVGRLRGHVAGIAHARIACFTVRGSGSGEYVGDQRVAVASGEFEVDDLPAGRYRLVFRFGATRIGVDVTGYHLPVEVVVDLRDGSMTEIEVEVRNGGRLRVAARGEDGGLLAAQCRIRDSAGHAVRALFHCRNERFGTAVPIRLGSLSASTVDPPLEPGVYEVDLELEGYRSWTGRVRVEPGKTTDIDERLQRVE